MPQVPYNPVPDVQETERFREMPGVSTPSAAFGANIAEAVKQGGQTLGQVGNELFARAMAIQELNNETTARETGVAATQKMAEDFEHFRTTTTGTPEELHTFLQGLEATHRQFRGNLNPMAAKMYNAEVASLQNRMTMAAAGENASALRKRSNASALAGIDQEMRTSADITNDKEWADKDSRVDRLLETAGAVNIPPWTDEELADKKLRAHEALRTNRISILSHTNINGAFDLFDKTKAAHEISPEEEDRLTKELRAENRLQTGTIVANLVWDPKKTQNEMEEEARGLARDRDYSHGDPDFEDAAVKAVQTKYSVEHQAIIHDQWTARQTADEMIQSGKYRTSQDAMADPTLSAAAKAAGPEYDVASKLRTFWSSRDAESNKANYDKLIGLAHDEPTKFLNEDLWAAKVSEQERGRLFLRRKQLVAGGQPDPNVSKAAAAITNIFPNSVPKKGTDPDRYRQFLGSLQGALEDLGAEQQRKLTVDDYEKLGRALMADQPGTGYITDYKVFEAPVPADILKYYREQGQNDDEIAYNYHRALAIRTMNNLVGGSSAPKK